MLGLGSNAYRDAWSLFDQILITQPLLEEDFSSFRFYKAGVFNKQFLIVWWRGTKLHLLGAVLGIIEPFLENSGHHTRSYLWQHQNTQTHIGNQAYPFGNPSYSLENNAFLTSELVEAVRRTHDKLAGMHNFSSITWFQNVYDAEKVKPYPTYYRMKNSLNPILVSAELWGRHYFTGDKLPTRFCIVNDKLNGEDLEASILEWEITYEDNRIVSSGECGRNNANSANRNFWSCR